jgi:Phosphotransferase enzyme family
MSEDRWRTCLRWVVAHPHRLEVLLTRRDGDLVLPETERPGQVWTADPAEVLPALVELLGADALLLDCLDDHQDPAARVQRATLVAVPREAPAAPEEMAWVGRDGLAGAGAAAWLSCAELAGYAVPPSLGHGDLHLSNVARGPAGYLFFDWTDACVAHPFLDLATIRRGTAFTDATEEAELRERLRQAYLPAWASFEPPGRLARAFELAAPLGALHQAVSYRSLATRPPMDPHMAQSTAWWLHQVPAGLG